MGDVFKNPSLTFNDGVRSIDYVLVWEANKDDAITPEAFTQRKVFETNLENEGLQLEREAPQNLDGLNFVKIHAPITLLKEYSAKLKLRMPMKPSAQEHLRERNRFLDRVGVGWNYVTSMFQVDRRLFPEQNQQLTTIYSKDKEHLFETDSVNFWTPSIRSRIVQFILERINYSENAINSFAFGITRLISKCTYSAAYPLHDGDIDEPRSMRHQLYREWACVSKIFKIQPLDYIKDYFGVKIGLYFTWLGFYTRMLIPASIVGILCTIYSALTLTSYTPSKEICSHNSTIKMCPTCDHHCDYWDLQQTCLHSRFIYFFDNQMNVLCAVFMSLWAVCFLELWKRYSAEMTHRWDLTGFDVNEEHPRPQYLARLQDAKTRLNVVTEQYEPIVPFWRIRVPATLMSYSVILLLVLVAVAGVLGVIVYTLTMSGAKFLWQDKSVADGTLIITITAPVLNLILILILDSIYKFLAERLTEMELLRTQTEFENSLTLKVYLLQFVNQYASIFYIAFFKGNNVGRPGNYIRLFGYRQAECAGGCLLELCKQLAIIMVGKQVLNAVMEYAMPRLRRWWNRKKEKRIISPLQWAKDFELLEIGQMGLFPEYLEMVLQYGFVTIFVAAFPLAPLFALINNVLEMRLDAKKFLSCYRRPVPQRVNDIGVWYRILDTIGKLSVITNGFIIAFTSDFIPRLVYRYEHGSLDGYVNFSLTQFNVTVLGEYKPESTTYDQQICSFPGYYTYKEDVGDYQQSDWYWHILAMRLVFVVIFQNALALMMIIIRWAIPDTPRELRERIRLEEYVVNSFLAKETLAQHRSPHTPPSQHDAAAHEAFGSQAPQHPLAKSPTPQIRPNWLPPPAPLSTGHGLENHYAVGWACPQ